MEMNWGKYSREVLPAGRYLVRITDVKRVTARTGTPQLEVSAVVVEGPSDIPEVTKGRTAREFLSITEKSLWRIAWFVADCGLDTSRLGAMSITSTTFSRIINMCIGRTTYWNVVVTDGRNKVSSFEKDLTQPAQLLETLEDVPGFLK